MPGSNAKSRFGMSTSVSSVRDVASSACDVRATRPVKSRPGMPRTVTLVSSPGRMEVAYASGTVR